MRHRPLNPRQTVAFWIEHVLQFGGEHLKPTSMQLTWWQFYCLDTLGFILLLIAILFTILCSLIGIVVKLALKLLKPVKHTKKD